MRTDQAGSPLRLAILISGRGSNMEAVAKACRDGRIAASVAVVIADHPDAGGLAVAQELGIETAVVSRKSFPERAAFERGLIEQIEAHRAEIIVLAGFMRVLSAEFTSRYEGRLLNIHPALLPKYKGLHTHARVLEAGDREHGASVHFVTAELDGGPVVLQSRIAVGPAGSARTAESESELAARVLRTEHIILPRVIGWLADKRLTWRDGKGWLDGRALEAPVVEDFDEGATK
jgi:phosphoribosylglycinamide formyltransferase-1